MPYWDRTPERAAKRRRDDWLNLVWRRKNFKGVDGPELPPMPEDFEKQLAEMFTDDMIDQLMAAEEGIEKAVKHMESAAVEIVESTKKKKKKK